MQSMDLERQKDPLRGNLRSRREWAKLIAAILIVLAIDAVGLAILWWYLIKSGRLSGRPLL